MSSNRAIMRGVSARVLWVGLAVAGIGGALDGCGGTLVRDPLGDAGNGGSSAPAGTTGRGGVSGSGGMSGSGDVSGSGGTAFGEPACLSTVVRGGVVHARRISSSATRPAAPSRRA